MNRIYILTIFAVLASISLKAQVLNTYSLYTQQASLITPANLTEDGRIEAFINSRRTMTEFNDAPRTLNIGLSGALTDKMGIGLRVLSDKRGALESSSLLLSYAYKIDLDNSQSVTFGVSGGGARRMVNYGKVNVIDLNDPTLSDDYSNKFNFDGDAGIWYQFKDLQLGISAPHLFEFQHHYVIFSRYNIGLMNDMFHFEPSVLVQTLPKSETQFDLNAIFDYKNKIWAGGTYRSNKDIILSLGINFEIIGLGYAYELNNSALSYLSKNNHEVFVRFNIGPKKPIRNMIEEQKKKKQTIVEVEQKKEQKKITTENDLRKRVEFLEQSILMERKLDKLEDEIETLKGKQTSLTETDDNISKEDEKNIKNFSTANTIQIEFANKEGKADGSLTKTSIAKTGYYVVVSTVKDPIGASKIAANYTKNGLFVKVINDVSKQYYYICSSYQSSRKLAMAEMKKERNKGNSDAWVCFIK